jgi:hypothetical protein
VNQNLDIQLVICPGRFPEKKHLSIYNKVYDCWKEVWSQTFLEIDKNPNLHSDAFTRQDFISAILVNGDCKALCFYRYVDAEASSTQKDSYFNNWSEIHLQKLYSQGSNVLVCSYLTVHPSARKDSTGVHLVEYLVGLATEVFLQSYANVMTGAMRKNRKAHNVTYNWGAIPVAQDVDSGHGDLVDLVAFFRENVIGKKLEHPVTEQFEKLWQDVIVVDQELPGTIKEFENRRSSQIKKAA